MKRLRSSFGTYASCIDRRDLERAMKYNNTAIAAAAYLGITVQTFQKHMKMYKTQDGKTLAEKFRELKKERGNKGNQDLNKGLTREFLSHVLDTGFIGRRFHPSLIKMKLMDEGYLPNVCECCGMNGVREMDMKAPLLLSFKDSIRSNWKLSNLQVLCYNCYFLKVGDLLLPDAQEILEFYGKKRKDKAIRDKYSTGDEISNEADEFYEEIGEQKDEFEKLDDFASDIISYKKLKK